MIIFTTGKAPYTNHTDILFSRELKKGVFTYKTGLSPKDIENNDILTDNDMLKVRSGWFLLNNIV